MDESYWFLLPSTQPRFLDTVILKHEQSITSCSVFVHFNFKASIFCPEAVHSSAKNLEWFPQIVSPSGTSKQLRTQYIFAMIGSSFWLVIRIMVIVQLQNKSIQITSPPMGHIFRRILCEGTMKGSRKGSIACFVTRSPARMIRPKNLPNIFYILWFVKYDYMYMQNMYMWNIYL